MRSRGDRGGIRAGDGVASRDGWCGDEPHRSRADEATRHLAQDNDQSGMGARQGNPRRGPLGVCRQEDRSRHHLPAGRLSTRVWRLSGFHDHLYDDRWSANAGHRSRLLFQRGLQLAPRRADAHRYASCRQEVRGSRDALRRSLEALTRRVISPSIRPGGVQCVLEPWVSAGPNAVAGNARGPLVAQTSGNRLVEPSGAMRSTRPETRMVERVRPRLSPTALVVFAAF